MYSEDFVNNGPMHAISVRVFFYKEDGLAILIGI